MTEISFSSLVSGGPFKKFATAVASSYESRKRVDEVPRYLATEASSVSRKRVEAVPRYLVTAMLSSSVSRKRVEAVPRNLVTEISSGY